ncbi:hypothetical protein Dimus_027037 [Dionaea muscipula]
MLMKSKSSNNNNNNNNSSSSSVIPSCSDPSTTLLDNTANSNSTTAKRKRRPAGTPDPEAEVVSLSPRKLLESDRYVCEICNQGFQRDQNLQMHRRRHKVPWKLLKRDKPEASEAGGVMVRKRVFVCPEPTCLHHDPCHALGDLVGIKKHFRRKHSNHKQWACHKCSKAYAVHSDFKAHLKTCGTRGHSCDCGRVFSRVESFIEHQDTCHMGRLGRSGHQHHHHDQAVETTVQQWQRRPQQLPQTVSGHSPSGDTNFNSAVVVVPYWATAEPKDIDDCNMTTMTTTTAAAAQYCHNLELQLSIGSPDLSDKNESSVDEAKGTGTVEELGGSDSVEQLLKVAMAEKAYAEAARREAKRQIQLAESEFARAKKMRQQAQAELDRAQALKEQTVKKISSTTTATLLQITCHACKQHYHGDNLS